MFTPIHLPQRSVPETTVTVIITHGNGEPSVNNYSLRSDRRIRVRLNGTSMNNEDVSYTITPKLKKQPNLAVPIRPRFQVQPTSGAGPSSSSSQPIPPLNQPISNQMFTHPPGFDPIPRGWSSTGVGGEKMNHHPLSIDPCLYSQADREAPAPLSLVPIDQSSHDQNGGQVVQQPPGEARERVTVGVKRGRPARGSEPRQQRQAPRKGPPYICETCKVVFQISQAKAAHMRGHYSKETQEQREARKEAKRLKIQRGRPRAEQELINPPNPLLGLTNVPTPGVTRERGECSYTNRADLGSGNGIK